AVEEWEQSRGSRRQCRPDPWLGFSAFPVTARTDSSRVNAKGSLGAVVFYLMRLDPSFVGDLGDLWRARRCLRQPAKMEFFDAAH
uniref:Uncharacterized protein n=1 Tax=Aegilops tauschii subsp. strangulata TaxID=200361 RepID=A0A453J7V6_AEGTS